MVWIKKITGSTLLGGLAGGVIGFLIAPEAIRKAYQGFSTIGRDLGPFLFIPVWMGGVVGFCSQLIRVPLLGMLLTVVVGMLAGFSAPYLHQEFFGRTPFHAGFLAYPMLYQFLLVFFGAIGGVVWYHVTGKML
ncbi:MAG: hypothetical protein HY400_06435 [Elusimicrobia bacterium]|nr:hypothetical protein [Elusimicrobiota bacterium]